MSSITVNQAFVSRPGEGQPLRGITFTYRVRGNIHTYRDVPGTDDRYDGAMNFIRHLPTIGIQVRMSKIG